MKRSSSILKVRLAAVAALTLLSTACDETGLPSSVEVEFPILQIRTVLPSEGSSIPAGSGQQPYQVDIVYQRSDAVPLELFFWVEVVERVGNRGIWQGDLAFDFFETSDERGTDAISGTFRMPRVSPFCGPMTHMQAVTIRDFEGAETMARLPDSEALSDKESLSQDFDVARFQVTNRPTLNKPCVITLESLVDVPDRFLFQWGQPVWIWGQRMPPQVGPAVEFAGGEVIDFTIPSGGEVDPDARGFDAWQLVQTWVPTNATDGPIRVFYEDVEADYGNDERPFIAVDEDAGDFFEPNDAPGIASDDPVDFGSRIYAVNPGLTIDDQDLEPDEALPQGAPWGRGDWWNLRTSTTTEVCGIIFMDRRDDQDLFLYDSNLQELDLDLSVGTDFALVVGTSNGAETLQLWIAPFDVQTDDRRYELFALDCELIFGSTSVTARRAAAPSLEEAVLAKTGQGPVMSALSRSRSSDVDLIRRAVERIRSGDLIEEARASLRWERAEPPPGRLPSYTPSPGRSRGGSDEARRMNR